MSLNNGEKQWKDRIDDVNKIVEILGLGRTFGTLSLCRKVIGMLLWQPLQQEAMMVLVASHLQCAGNAE